MTKPKILVVEDESVVAADIEDSLEKLGYQVAGSAASAKAAIRRAVETEPDLVLMDIKLKGKLDGIDAARELHDRLGIPVVFLTAFADGEILSRAKHTSPSGYVLKPFDQRALRSALEIALHRYPQERKLAASEKRLLTALRGFNEAVILTDAEGKVTLLNREAERLSGWKQDEAKRRPVNDVAVFLDATTGSLRRGLIVRAIREGATLGFGDNTVLLSRDKSEVLVEGTINPLRDDSRAMVGAAIVFRAASSNEVVVAELRGGDRYERLGRLAAGFANGLEKALGRAADALDRCGARPADRDWVAAAVRSLDEARRIGDRLNSYTKPGRTEVVSVNEVIEGMEAVLEQLAGERAVVTCLDQMAGSVLADPSRLEQVILELVLLAVRRLPRGGKVTIETDSVHLLPEFTRNHTVLDPGLHSLIEISYSGATMRPAAKNAMEDCPAACQDVRELSGDLVLRDEPGRVTTYEIYLPFVEEAL